ncbi:hypothetical protein ACSMEV_15145 [Pseudomonas sp. MLB6B]|uniref:hypothetical protein n=1 Tax=unclassified Pseudomonas TaxID=196821 RepID=UPI0025D247D4|nr:MULTISPECIES: hypothetical protein [unclassified Pseudomonas]
MSGKFISRWFYASLTSETKPAGLFGNKTKEVYSSRHVNFDEYANLLRDMYEAYDAEGYDVVNVVPVSMGQTEQCLQSNGNYVGDVGFSITRGAVVIGKKREQ